MYLIALNDMKIVTLILREFNLYLEVVINYLKRV
jgi:hypothetical protein